MQLQAVDVLSRRLLVQTMTDVVGGVLCPTYLQVHMTDVLFKMLGGTTFCFLVHLPDNPEVKLRMLCTL